MSPYGESKYSAEMLIKSLSKIHKDWKMISLRYFNPAGAHPSGYLGDWPSNYPGNLFPVIQDLIIGKRKALKVFGTDYNTPDGSGVRDYLHVTDLGNFDLIQLEVMWLHWKRSWQWISNIIMMFSIWEAGVATVYSKCSNVFKKAWIEN